MTDPEQRPEPTQQDIDAAAKWMGTESVGFRFAMSSEWAAEMAKSLARLLAETRAAQHERTKAGAKVCARGACRAGEKCQDDGGCAHVPCITARQIEGEISRLTLADVNGGEKSE